MDKETSLQELKDKVKNFSEARDWDQFHDAKELAIGIITEASELLEPFRFKKPEEFEAMLKNPEKKAEISKELADVLIFVLRFAQMYNIDLSKEVINKLEESEKRYPVEKSKGSNKKYTELK